MKKLNGFIAIIIVITMMVMLVPAVASSTKDLDITKYTFSQPENLGVPIKSSYILKATVSMEDGIPIACTVTSGTPAKFNVVNLNNGTVIRSFDIPVGDTFWVVESDEQGIVYFAGYVNPNLYRYDPTTKEVEDLGRIPDTKATVSMTFDNNNNPYIGTFPSGTIIKYDVKQKKFQNLGKQTVNDQYVKALATYNNKVYFGQYGPGLYQVDLKTGKRTAMPEHPKYKGIKGNGVGKFTTVDNYLIGIFYYYTEPTKYHNILCIYDMEKDEWLDFSIEDVEGQYISPELNGKVYYNLKADQKVYSLDLETLESKSTGIGCGLMRGDGFVEVDNEKIKGKCYVNAEYEGGIAIMNFETGEVVRYTNFLDGSPAGIRDLEFGNDGRLYISEYMGSKGAQWDLGRNEINYFHLSQGEGMAAVGDKMIIGTYGRAVMYDLDTTKPVDKNYEKDNADNNPYNIGSLGEGQDRPFAVAEADGKAIIGSISTYGELGGALSIYDPQTKEFDVYRNIVQDHSVLGVAYKDGIIYGSTTVSGGLNTTPTKTKAEIFKFDMKTRELITSVVPKISTLSKDVGAWGELVFDNYGMLWAHTDGLLICLNPETLEVKREITTIDSQPNAYGQYWSPTNLRFTKEGALMFSDGGKVRIVNPVTGEGVVTSSPTSAAMVIGPDGNYYYPKGSEIMKVKVYYGEDETKKSVENTITMKVESNNAYVNGTITKVDPYNKDVVPVVKDGRTLLPVRFLAESLGAKVEWIGEISEAILTLGETVIKVKIGSEQLDVNGEKKPLDVSAQTINDRTFLPLRAISEAFNKEVQWDDRGIIVIKDKDGKILGKEEITKIIEIYF